MVIQVKGYVFHLPRMRKIIYHPIQQRLNPLIAIGRTNKNRGKLSPNSRLADGPAKKLRTNFVFQDSFRQLIGGEGHRVQQLFPIANGLITKFSRDFFLPDVLAARAVKINCLQTDQVNHSS